MTEVLPPDDSTPQTAPSPSARVWALTARAYQVTLGILALGLLISRTDPNKLTPDGALLLLLLLISIACGELFFHLSPEIVADLAGLFSGAAVLTLGFNGVWVPFMANLYWIVRRHRHEWEDVPIAGRTLNALYNLSMNALPPWLGLFVYADLLNGTIPLADVEIGPTAAFVLVQWFVLAVGMLPIVLIARRVMRDVIQPSRDAFVGLALSIYAPVLFSPVVAVILNHLGLSYFLFITVGLLGISLMAQRLAHSLASERRRVGELAALNTLSEAILRNPPGAEPTPEFMVQYVPRFVPDAGFELCLFRPKELERRQIMVSWRDGTYQPATDAPLTPLWTWLRNRREPLYVSDIAQALVPFTWDDRQDGPLPGTLLLVPMLASDPDATEEERCVGGILLTHRRANALDQLLPSITALAHQLAAALENARLYEEALARERLERELTLARTIQTSFLPADVPDLEGWSFVASLEPARHVSGDFYDFIHLTGERWGILIADVADKGMPAALYMALARTLIRAHAHDHPEDPAACLQAANNQILTDTRADSFVTAFYAILNPFTGGMIYANAGHHPPYLCRRNVSATEALRATGMPLGIMPGIELTNVHVHLEPGNLLVLYTDGVTEAQDMELNEFGDDRLLAEIMNQDDSSAAAIHRRIHGAIQEFVGDAHQFDDLTLLVVGRE